MPVYEATRRAAQSRGGIYESLRITDVGVQWESLKGATRSSTGAHEALGTAGVPVDAQSVGLFEVLLGLAPQKGGVHEAFGRIAVSRTVSWEALIGGTEAFPAVYESGERADISTKTGIWESLQSGRKARVVILESLLRLKPGVINPYESLAPGLIVQLSGAVYEAGGGIRAPRIVIFESSGRAAASRAGSWESSAASATLRSAVWEALLRLRPTSLHIYESLIPEVPLGGVWASPAAVGGVWASGSGAGGIWASG